MGNKGNEGSKNKIDYKKIKNEFRLNNQQNINLKAFGSFSVLATKSICIITLKNGYGTEFFCKIPYPNDEHLFKCLITNNHVLKKNFFETNNEIKLEIDNISYSIDLNINRKIWTNEEIDYTIIEIKKEDNIEYFLTYDDNITRKSFSYKDYKDEGIIVPTFMENRQLETDKGKVILSSNNFLFFHNLNTDEGSSGGPIVLVNNYRVMGIHRGSYEEYNKNLGIFLCEILKTINEENIIVFCNNIHKINKLTFTDVGQIILYNLNINGKDYEFTNERKELKDEIKKKFIEKNNNRITLFNSNGEEVFISLRQGFNSGLIKNIFLIDSEVKKIPLVFDGETLTKIKEYLEHYDNLKPKEINVQIVKANNNLRDSIEEWDYNFINLSDKIKLIRILNASYYMDIHHLQQLASAKIASLIKGRTSEEITEDWNLNNDYNQEDVVQNFMIKLSDRAKDYFNKNK